MIGGAGLLAWLLSGVVAVIEAGSLELWPLAFMAGAYGLSLWVGIAVALVPAAWVWRAQDAANSSELRAGLACLLAAALVMALSYWPLRALALALLPSWYAYHDALATLAAAYGAWGLACIATWLAWRFRYRSPQLPSWSFAPLFLVARASSSSALSLALPGREHWADAALLGLIAICFISLVPRLPRALWAVLGAGWAAGMLALLAGFAALPGARAVFVAKYPGAAGLVVHLSSLVDIDGDGVSGWLAGTDCDDLDPKVSPFALEIAGNGIDDNCMGGDLPLAAPVGSRPVEPGAARLAHPHNLVLVTLDTTRADLLDPQHMPQLSRFAERAATFRRAYTAAPYTTDSTRCMLTGQPLMNIAISSVTQDLGREASLQERLHDAGYDTSIVVLHWWKEEGSWAYSGFNQRLEAATDQPDPYRAISGPQVTQLALAEIDRLSAAGKPFFVWIHHLDPHAEYRPRAGTPFSQRRDELGRYHQEVWATDYEFGRLVDHLEQRDFFADGALVVHSDHGELVDDAGRTGHALWLDEGVLRVLLVMRGPDIPAGRYDTRVSLIDLFPTLLEWSAGIAAPSFGRSLAPIWQREETADREIVVYSPYVGSRQGAFLQGPYKLIQDFMHGSERLYDLSQDPAERVNLVDTEPELAARLERRYAEIWDQSMNDRVMARRAQRQMLELCQRGNTRACSALERATNRH